MAIEGVEQPAYMEINETLRLRRYDGTADFALPWYQDEALVYLVDGDRKPYSRETLYAMYSYLNARGEMYFIEALENCAWAPIGDVAFSREDMPIVIGEPAYEKPLWELSGGERVQPVKLMMIEDTTSGHASSFVVTLADGRFLLYDTGYDTTADQLMNYMKANNRFSDGKVHIAAIIISHPHTDHMDGLTALADKYSSQIECGAVMYNLVSTDMQSVLADSSLDSRQKSFNTAAEKLGSEVYCLRGGQKFEFAGTTFEVMFTADELGDFELTGVNSSGETDTTYDMNNSSLILRMTESGQTMVFTGDCRGGEAGIISSMFSAGFDADMMAVAHHGFNVVGTLWMYNKARPQVLFWTIKSADSDVSRSFVKQLMAANYVKKHFYEDTQTEITLPYDPAS